MPTTDPRPWLNLYPPHVPAEFEARGATALELFEIGVKERPHAPAIHFFETTLSFAEADAAAHALAAALLEAGLKPGDRVGLYLQNDPQFLIALHAIWLAAGTAVALNPMLTPRELVFQLRDSGASTVICLEALFANVAEALPATNVRRVIVTSEFEYTTPSESGLAARASSPCPGATWMAELLRRHDGARVPPPQLKGGDVALLCYTSGTTGPPKAAMLTHRNLAYAEVYHHVAGVDADDVVMGAAPLFHVTGITGHIMISRLCSAPIVLFHRFDAGFYLRMLERWKGSFSILALTAYIAILNHEDIGSRDMSSLKKVFTGGAPVSAAVVERFEQATGRYMHNTYGMTETSSPTHMVPLGLRAPVDEKTKAIAVGLPVPNVHSKIVDLETGERRPPGEIGEINSSGPGVVPGYWNKPRETAHALRGGYMRTGDVGVADDNGWFYLVDRAKDMIVASGYKVWPREVEDVIYEYPGVLEVAVVGTQDGYRGETVRAFVSLKRGAAITEKEIIEHCRSRLAAYKYPRVVEIVGELPKTLTGKVRRRDLREADGEEAS